MLREAGLVALAGTSDFAIISMRTFGVGSGAKASSSEKASAKLTYNLFLDRIINYVSSYVVKILGAPSEGSHPLTLDGIVFSGGIGEKSVELRRDVAAYFKWLGVEIDEKANKSAGKSGDPNQTVFEISTAKSKFKVFMCLTVGPPSFLPSD